mmetsp:Transcript_45097/g.119698  ORF Transcript_45097/g.119698 Transcript_45097/m.119698 type:complete len:209 (+) Transcript_45097:1097-1723(+)
MDKPLDLGKVPLRAQFLPRCSGPLQKTLRSQRETHAVTFAQRSARPLRSVHAGICHQTTNLYLLTMCLGEKRDRRKRSQPGYRDAKTRTQTVHSGIERKACRAHVSGMLATLGILSACQQLSHNVRRPRASNSHTLLVACRQTLPRYDATSCGLWVCASIEIPKMLLRRVTSCSHPTVRLPTGENALRLEPDSISAMPPPASCSPPRP